MQTLSYLFFSLLATKRAAYAALELFWASSNMGELNADNFAPGWSTGRNKPEKNFAQIFKTAGLGLGLRSSHQKKNRHQLYHTLSLSPLLMRFGSFLSYNSFIASRPWRAATRKADLKILDSLPFRSVVCSSWTGFV